MEQNKPKAKRKLKSLDFSGEDAAVSLVGPCVGGPANQIPTLVIKAATQFSDEFLEKMSKVRVELDIVEYLTRFYGLLEENAEVLAQALGFVTEEMEENEAEDSMSEKEYIAEKVRSIEVMKALYEADNISEVLSALSEEQYYQLLKDQEMLEKAYKKIDRKKKQSSKSVKAEEEASTNASVEKSGEESPVVKQKEKGNKTMTKDVQVIEQEVEVIAKSQFDLVQKALDEQKVELQKALDLVAELQKEKKQAIAKARMDNLKAVVGDNAEVIFKACGEASDEDFSAVIGVLANIAKSVEEAGLFKEVGVHVEEVSKGANPLQSLIDSKYKKQ